MYNKKWKPSKAQAKAFAVQMDLIQRFCDENHIDYSSSMDSYYFTINDVKYRVSNHSVEASNASAVNELGQLVHQIYHSEGRRNDTVYIHASKTRIIDIYNDIKNGWILDGKGYRKYNVNDSVELFY